LDGLALKVVRDARVQGTQPRDRVAALKTAAGWYGISRKGLKPDDGQVSAWDTYRQSQQTNGEDKDDAETDPA
jgi:hypothetical protein